MATDIKISELNQITVNSDLNQLIINDRENAGDTGVSKKIQISNLLTPNIVKTDNITDCAVITSKINDKAVTAGKIADNTITSSQITCCSITNSSLATNSVDNRTVNNSDNFTFNCVTAATNVTTPIATVTNKLTVGAIGGGKTVSLNGINYDFPPTEVPNYFLQTDGSGNLTWEEAVPGDGTALVFSEISPVGTIISWAGAALPSDGKWLECNGTTFDGTDFPELSSVLDDTWGTHSGVNYYLPDLKGRAAVGAGTGNDGTDSCAFTLGTSGGEYNHQLSITEMPSHNHCVNMTNDAMEVPTNNYCRLAPGQGTRQTSGINVQIQSTGGGASHNNIQPYAVTRYIIKALPDDIQQFGMNVGPGLSALNASGGQTASIDLSSSEIGLKVTDDFQFDGSGRLDIANVSFAKLDLPSNFPVQTVQAVKRDTQTISGPALGVSNFVEISGLTKTITRHNIGSSVRIQGNLSTSTNGNGHHGVAVRLLRDGVVIDEATGNAAGNRLRVTSNGSYAAAYGNETISFDFIDTPSSASAGVIYSVEARTYSAQTGWINRSYYNTDINNYEYRTISTITLTELTP